MACTGCGVSFQELEDLSRLSSGYLVHNYGCPNHAKFPSGQGIQVDGMQNSITTTNWTLSGDYDEDIMAAGPASFPYTGLPFPTISTVKKEEFFYCNPADTINHRNLMEMNAIDKHLDAILFGAVASPRPQEVSEKATPFIPQHDVVPNSDMDTESDLPDAPAIGEDSDSELSDPPSDFDDSASEISMDGGWVNEGQVTRRDENGGEYTAWVYDSILDVRKVGAQTLYLVNWSYADPSWQPAIDLQDNLEDVMAFHADHPEKSGPPFWILKSFNLHQSARMHLKRNPMGQRTAGTKSESGEQETGKQAAGRMTRNSQGARGMPATEVNEVPLICARTPGRRRCPKIQGHG